MHGMGWEVGRINNKARYVILTRIIERFSTECRKAKTKAITLTNHKRRKQRNEPIKERSNSIPCKAREKACKQVTMVLVVLLIGWRVARGLLIKQSHKSRVNPKQTQIAFNNLIENCLMISCCFFLFLFSDFFCRLQLLLVKWNQQVKVKQ